MALVTEAKDMSSDPQTYVKNVDMVTCGPLTPVLLGAETRELLGLAGHQPHARFSEKLCFKGIR